MTSLHMMSFVTLLCCNLSQWSLPSQSITDHLCGKHNNIAMAMLPMYVRSRVNINIVLRKWKAAIVFGIITHDAVLTLVHVMVDLFCPGCIWPLELYKNSSTDTCFYFCLVVHYLCMQPRYTLFVDNQ